MKRGGIRDDHGHGLIPQVVLEFLKVVIRKHAPFGKKLFPGPVVQAQQLTRAPAGNSSLGVSAEDHPFQHAPLALFGVAGKQPGNGFWNFNNHNNTIK